MRQNESGDDFPLIQQSDVCAALRRASRSVTHLYDLVLLPTGLKATQVVILLAIQQCGELAQWRLADQLGVSGEALSRRLATLRKAGLIVQRIGVERSGERLYQLTANGVRKCEEVTPYWKRAQARLRTTIGLEKWEALLDITHDVAEKARSAEHLRCVNSEDLFKTEVEQAKKASAPGL